MFIDSLSSSRILLLISSSLLINNTTYTSTHTKCHIVKRQRVHQLMANTYNALLKLTSIFIVIASAPELCGSSKTFTIVNYCQETIWPGITHSENFSGDGFTLKPGQSAQYTAPAVWSGRIWARTGCNFDKNGKGKCQTGSCGTNINCTDPGTPPATIADFTLGEPDFYDVSLVDGFNLPLSVRAVNGTGGNCSTAGCDGDLRQNCPPELAAKDNGKVIACRSACDAFNTDEYCCRGIYGSSATCLPSNYSKIFKQACPAAYSFAHDDPTSLTTCSQADFIVTFCGSRNQTVCSYHDKQVVCNVNGSKAYKEMPQRWWVMMLPFAYMFNLRIMS